MKEDKNCQPLNYSNQDNKSFNISMLTASQTPQSPPRESMLSPRSIMTFFTKNLDEISSPRDLMNSIQKLGRENSHNKALSPFKAQEIQKQFKAYLQTIETNMIKYKSNTKKKCKEANTKNQRQQIQNQVKLSKIPKQYFDEWTQQSKSLNQQQKQTNKPQLNVNLIGIQYSNNQHQLSHKLQLLMIPSAQLLFQSPSQQKKKRSKINLRQKQEELSEYLDQIQLIIFTKSKKYPDKYLCYLDNISSADYQIQNSLNLIKQFRKKSTSKLALVANKYKKTKILMTKQKNLKEILKWLSYMKIIETQKKKSENKSQKIQKQSKQHYSILPTIIKQNNQKLDQLKSIKKMLANLQQINRKVKENRLMLMKKQLQEILGTIMVTYEREDWLRNQMPKNTIKDELYIKAGIQESLGDCLNNSFLNVSVLDQSYCMGSVKSGGSSTDLKPNSLKKITGLQQKKQLLSKHWQQYFQEYYQEIDYLQQQQQIFGQLILKQLLKHNSSFTRDIQDYLTLIYSQKNLIQEAQTHQQRLYYLQSKFYNKILIVYYDAVKNVISFVNGCFYQLKETRQKIYNFIKQRIQDFIKIRKINANTNFEEVVSIIFGSFDYWLNDTNFLSFNIPKSQQYQAIKSEQTKCIASWQEYILTKKVKLIQEYINNLHETTIVSKIKTEVENEDFQSVSISSEYFLAFDYILNWGQVSNQDAKSNQKIDLEMSLSFLGDLDNPILSEKPQFSIFKIIDKVLIIQGTKYKIMKSFFLLLTQIEAYLKVKSFFPELTKKIDEKICQSIGFYSWYCKKILINKNNTGQKRSYRGLCMFKQICGLLNKILQILNISSVPKKLEKLQNDMKSIITTVNQEISMHSLLLIQNQISKLYQSRLKVRKQIPTAQSMRIIDILEKCRQFLQEFGISVKQSLHNSVKIICKNYFGYLLNMETRGKEQLKWFLPKLKDCVGDIFVQQISAVDKKFTLTKF